MCNYAVKEQYHPIILLQSSIEGTTHSVTTVQYNFGVYVIVYSVLFAG